MIPVRLQLKNFMSYGESVPPLELAGMNLAVLSGENGNGKTALLDAITWALFGETRAQTEDDLIKLGASDCRVLLDFTVENQKYRVHKGRGRKGGAVWELQIWQEDGTLRSLSGTSSRDTKSRIQGLLRMDYKTFLATGYLAQGRADEFARASVNDRKKVLADILDLSRYERLEELAKEKRKEAEDKELDAERQLGTIDAQLELEDRHHFALEAAQARLNELQATADAIRANFDTVRLQIERMEDQEEKARTYEEGISDRDDANRQAERDLNELTKRIAQAEGLTVQAAQIETRHARFVQLSADVVPLQAQYREVMAMQRDAQSLETAIQKEHAQVDNERYRLQCEAENLQNETKDEGRYEAVLRDVEQQLHDLGDLEDVFAQADEERRKADEQVVELRAAFTAQKAEQARLQTRLDALSASDAALCEYCGQALPPAKRQQAIDETQADWDVLAQQMKRVSAQGKAAKGEADHWQKETEAVQKKRRVLAGLLSPANGGKSRVIPFARTDKNAAPCPRKSRRIYGKARQARLRARGARQARANFRPAGKKTNALNSVCRTRRKNLIPLRVLSARWRNFKSRSKSWKPTRRALWKSTPRWTSAPPKSKKRVNLSAIFAPARRLCPNCAANKPTRKPVCNPPTRPPDLPTAKLGRQPSGLRTAKNSKPSASNGLPSARNSPATKTFTKNSRRRLAKKAFRP